MGDLKLALQLASLRLPLKKALATAARLGAKAVELDAQGELKPLQLSQTALHEVRRLLDDHGLRVSAVSFVTRRGYDVPDELERRVDATKAAMRFARAMGASVVVNHVGRVPDEPQGKSWELLVQVLTDLGNHGNHVGALLAAQTGSESGADLARLLAALPPGAIGVDLDPAALIVHDHSIPEAVTAIGPHIVHVHARDAVRDAGRGRGSEVPLGRGMADFPALIGQLEEHNYRGYFTAAREFADDPTSELATALKYLRSL